MNKNDAGKKIIDIDVERFEYSCNFQSMVVVK